VVGGSLWRRSWRSTRRGTQRRVRPVHCGIHQTLGVTPVRWKRELRITFGASGNRRAPRMNRLDTIRVVTRYRRIVALGVMVVAVTACWIFYGSDPVSGHVTSYYATCIQKSADNRCTAVGRTLDPTVFRVSVALQRVESFRADGELVQLRSCAVTSKRDWRCRSSTDDSFEFGFGAGRPWVRIQGSDTTDLVFLPRWRYLWLKSGEPHGELFPNRFLFR
jgi:hypothetical protein